MHRWALQMDGVATFTKNSVAYLRMFGHHVHILTWRFGFCYRAWFAILRCLACGVGSRLLYDLAGAGYVPGSQDHTTLSASNTAAAAAEP